MPGSSSTNAPKSVTRVTVPFTRSPTLYFSASGSHGWCSSCSIPTEIRFLGRIYLQHPHLHLVAGSSTSAGLVTRPHAMSLTCNSASTPPISTNAPYSVRLRTVPVARSRPPSPRVALVLGSALFLLHHSAPVHHHVLVASSGKAATCILGLAFAPTTPYVSGEMDLVNNAWDSPQKISLYGAIAQTATQLSFDTPPPATLITDHAAGTVVVGVRDNFGFLVSSYSAEVTLTVTGPGGYSHTYLTAPVLGLASFSFGKTNKLTTAGTYTYTATSVGLTPATAIEVVNKPASMVAFTTPPPSTVQLGRNAGTVSVAIEDSDGNVVTTSTAGVTLTVTGPNDYSQTYSKNATAGAVSFDFSSALLTVSGTYTYTATSSNLTSATSTEAVNNPYVNFTAGPNGMLEIPSGFGLHQVVSFTSQTVAYGGSTTEVSAVPNANYHFVNWTDSTTGAPFSGNNPLIISNVTASLSLTANFSGLTPTTTMLSTYASDFPGATTVFPPGAAITFTAAITPPGGTGLVTFTDGANTLGTASPNGGVAQLAVSNLSLGAHSIGAAYGGDANYLSSSATMMIIVAAPGTSMIITGGQASTDFGQVAQGQTATSNLSLTFSATTTLGNISAVTQGATSQDFTVQWRDVRHWDNLQRRRYMHGERQLQSDSSGRAPRRVVAFR